MKRQQIKEKVKERYGKIALAGNSKGCCTPTECCGGGVSLTSPIQIAKNIEESTTFIVGNFHVCLPVLISIP